MATPGEDLTQTLGQILHGIGIVVADGRPPIVVPCDMLQERGEGPGLWDVIVWACRRKVWGKGCAYVYISLGIPRLT